MPVLIAPAEQQIRGLGTPANPTVEYAAQVAGRVGAPIDRQVETIEARRDEALELAGEGAVGAHERHVSRGRRDVPLGEDVRTELAPGGLDVLDDLRVEDGYKRDEEDYIGAIV